MSLVYKKPTREISNSDYRIEYESWCLKNDIKIYYRAISYNAGRIIIEDKGVKTVGSKTYLNDTSKLKRSEVNWNHQINILYTIKYFENHE